MMAGAVMLVDIKFEMKRIRLISIVLLVGLISACGFQLRGVSNLPDDLKQIRLIDHKLTINQKSQLSAILIKAGARLHRDNLNNPIQLSVTITSLPDRNLADAGTGQTIVRITKQLHYSVKKSQDTTSLQTRSIERQADIAQDSNNLLGTESEKQSVEETLERALFNQLIDQLKKL